MLQNYTLQAKESLMKTSELSFDERLEQLGAKSVKLMEKKLTEKQPAVEKLLIAFGDWLDKKLLDQPK